MARFRVLLILAVALCLPLALSSCGAKAVTPPVVVEGSTIEVAARSFAYSPDRIEIRAGVTYSVKLRSQDAVHDLVIDGIGPDGSPFQLKVAPYATSTAQLRIDEPGTYTFYCSVPGHHTSGMQGTLIVS